MATTICALGDRNPAFLTHREIDAAMALAPPGVEIRWLPTEGAHIDAYDGVWVLPGTPYRDDDAVTAAIRLAREQGMPILGTCGGFQYMAVEFARNVAGISGAGHEEVDPGAEEIVVGRLACSLVGEERMVTARPGTRLASLCGLEPFVGFHYCNYGLLDVQLDRLVATGLVPAAAAEDAGVEAFELPGHPFYLATLFQPQVGSSARQSLHPVLAALVEASR